MNAAITMDPPLAYTDDPRAFGEVQRCVAAVYPGYFFGCGYPAGDDWVHTLDLLGPDPHHLRRILARRTSPDVTEAASSLLRAYASALVTITTATYLALPYVPDLAPSNLWLQFDARGDLAALTLGKGRCIIAARTEDTMLRCSLWRSIALDHITPLISALGQHTSCSTDQLWTVAASACADVVIRFDAALSDAPRRAA